MAEKQTPVSQAKEKFSKIQTPDAVNSNCAPKDVKLAADAKLPKEESKKVSGANSQGPDKADDGSSTLPAVTSDSSLQLPSPSKEVSLKPATKSALLSKLSDIDLPLEEEKRRRRMERFGPTSSSTPPKIVASLPLSAEEELEKRRKRGERFGGSVSSTGTPSTSDLGKNLASSLSALSALDEGEKLRLRAKRFGIENATSPSKRKLNEASVSKRKVRQSSSAEKQSQRRQPTVRALSPTQLLLKASP